MSRIETLQRKKASQGGGSCHGQPVVVAIPTPLLFHFVALSWPLPRPWYLLGCARVGSFWAFLVGYVDLQGLEIFFYSHVLGL